MLRISVIIPTYNRCDHLNNTIVSIKTQNFPENYEIIVVDNNSTDKTKELIDKLNETLDNKVRYIFEPKIGLHNGRHAGAKAANGEILVYIDDDVICHANWLKELVKPYEDPNVGCVGGKILPKWETEPPEWIQMYPSYLSLLDLGNEMKELEKPMIYGCNLSIRKDLLYEVGGFNPDGFGDWNLIWYRGDGETGIMNKVLKRGKKLIHNPDAIVWHVIPKERITLKYFRKRAFIQGISDSFSDYRIHNYNILKKICRLLIYGFLSIYNTTLLLTKRYPSKDYIESSLNSQYFKSKCIYSWKMISDKDIKKQVKNNSWLND